MSVSDLNNTPIEFDIDGKSYKVKKLSILDIFEQIEKKIKEKFIQDISSMAKVLPDKDRADFLRASIKEIPTGKRMEEQVGDYLNTTQGGIDILITILNKCQQISSEEVMAIISKASNTDMVSQVMSYAMGQGKEEAKDDGETKQKKL